MIALKKNTKIVLLYILEALIAFACIYFSNALILWLNNLFGTKGHANVYCILCVFGAGCVAFAILFVLGKMIVNLYRYDSVFNKDKKKNKALKTEDLAESDEMLKL